jgi:gliding motility-associated-like protein
MFQDKTIFEYSQNEVGYKANLITYVMQLIKVFHLIFLLSSCLSVCVAQKQNSTWVFGLNAKVHFGNPIKVDSVPFISNEGGAAYSDSSGKLIFYSDGIDIFDSTNNIILSGLLGGKSSTQSSIILKQPGENNNYAIFTTPQLEFNNSVNGLRFSLFTYNVDSLKWVFIIKNQIIIDTCTEKLHAAIHENGKDFWIIGQSLYSNRYSIALLTENGIDTIIKTAQGINKGHVGFLKFSSNTEFVANAYFGNGVDIPSSVEVLNFNNKNGNLKYLFSIIPPTNSFAISNKAYSVEFSSDARKLYVGYALGKIYQYDLCELDSSQVKHSEQNIYQNIGVAHPCLQLLNDKIYFSQVYYLGVINKPNLSGSLCSVVDSVINLGRTRSLTGFCNFPVYNINKINLVSSNTSACVGSAVSLTLTGLPTCLGTGFSVSPSTASITPLTSHIALFTSSLLGVHTISGFAQSGTVTSWPMYHVVTVSGCVSPSITGSNQCFKTPCYTYRYSVQSFTGYTYGSWSVTGGIFSNISPTEIEVTFTGVGVQSISISSVSYSNTFTSTFPVTVTIDTFNKYLCNPSFEDIPLPPSTAIRGWTSCVQTPDRQPGNWNITLPAFNGHSYVGLAKSMNYLGSETVGQTLNLPISKDSIYFFSNYIAWLPQTGGYYPPYSITFPGFIFLQMGTSLCSRKNKILKSGDFTVYTDWVQSCAIFKPDSNFSSISFTPWGYDQYTLLDIWGENPIGPNSYGKYLLMDNLELTSIQNKLSYTLTGSNTSACVGSAVSLTLTGLPTCLGTGFSVSPSTASITPLTSHIALFTSSFSGVHTISGFAQSGTVTSWPVYHVVTVTNCPPPEIPTITGVSTVCSSLNPQTPTGGLYSIVNTELGVNYNWSFDTQTGTGTSFTITITNSSPLGGGQVGVVASNAYGTVSGFYTVTVTNCSPPIFTCTGGCPPNTSCTGTVCSPIVISETATCSGLHCTEILTCSGTDCIKCFGVVCTLPSTCIGNNCCESCPENTTCISGLCSPLGGQGVDTCTTAFPPCTCVGQKCDTIVPPSGARGLFKVYTAFTPNNGDNLNNTWVIDSLYPPNEIIILDKWGNEVYHASPYNNDWDGKHNGKDLPSGVYYYILDYQNRKRAGVVTIVR